IKASLLKRPFSLPSMRLLGLPKGPALLLVVMGKLCISGILILAQPSSSMLVILVCGPISLLLHGHPMAHTSLLPVAASAWIRPSTFGMRQLGRQFYTILLVVAGCRVSPCWLSYG